MPSVPIRSVASALNFGSCRTVISGESSTILQYTALRYSRSCDVDCDVTLLRIGQNDRFCAAAQQRSMRLNSNANASEALQFQELRRHPPSSPLTASHATQPASHAGGHRFESCRTHHSHTCESAICNFHLGVLLKYLRISLPRELCDPFVRNASCIKTNCVCGPEIV